MNNFFKIKQYVTNELFTKKALELNLSLDEFIMLTYFDNDNNNYLDMDNMSNNLGLSLDKAYLIFNNLVSKKLIDIKTDKDLDGRMIEKVSLDPFYDLIYIDKQKEAKEETKTDIYGIFESEFARPISSMEYEIINAWLEKGYTEELIKGALKEATYNGVKNLRYIDKILYEWNKKGFKTMADVSIHLESRDSKPKEELFDYNWLDDNED